MFGKPSALLALVAVALEVTSVSAQACINFAFAPAGTCNSDLNSNERLRADLVQDRVVPGCANGGLYTVVAKYLDLTGATRWVSAIVRFQCPRAVILNADMFCRMSRRSLKTSPERSRSASSCLRAPSLPVRSQCPSLGLIAVVLLLRSSRTGMFTRLP